MTSFLIVLASAATIAAGGLCWLCWRLNQRREEAERECAELKAREGLLAEKERLYGQMRAQSEAQFGKLAQQILEDREEKLRRDGTNPLKDIVVQLKADIETFKKNINDSRDVAGRDHEALMGKIAGLVELTNQVTEQANNLAGAIRGDAQLTGEWGEIQLKRVLDLSGMTENASYTYQETFEDDATGRRSKRTDFVIKMPGDRALIIDSKNTIAAAERYHGAANDEDRKVAEEAILASVRGHVDEIAAAEYQNSVPNSLKTVLMYIPLEEVYMLAMKAAIPVGNEHELLRDYARRRNVIFVNSASVVPVIRLIEMMWTVERNEKNQQNIITAAEEVLRRANDFVDDFLAIGDAFRGVFEKYESARKSLVDAPKGHSICKAVASLHKLGVQARTRSGKAYELAQTHMQQYYPEWSTRFSAVCRDIDLYTALENENCGRFRWTISEDGLEDPEGYLSMTAEEILSDLYK